MSNPGELSSRFVVGVVVGANMVDKARDRMILLRIEVGLNDGTITPDIFVEATEPLPPDPPDPPEPGAGFDMGIRTRSGFGGIPLALPPASSITGTGASDFVINSEGELTPSGTYGAVKSFSKTLGQTYTLTFSDASERVVTLTDEAHFTATLTDTASNFQLRTYLTTAGQLGPLTGRDCLINPTRAYWRIRPPAAGYGAAIVVRSENPTSGNDPDGNPWRGGGCVIGALAFDPSQLAHIPVVFTDITFHNDVDGPHSAFLSYTTTTGSGISSVRCRYENASNVSFANLNNCFTCRGATAQYNACVYARKGITGGITDPTLAALYPTYVDDNIASGMTADGVQMIGQNLYVRRNHEYNALDSASGEHPDAAQHLGTQAQDFTLPLVVEENTFVQNGGAWFQGIFYSDTTSPWWLTQVSIARNIYLGALRGLTLTRGQNPSIKNNLILKTPGNPLGNAIFDIATCTGADVDDNVCNTYILGSNSGTDNLSIVASLAAYQTAMPAYSSGPDLKTRAATLAACTPANLVIASGGFKKANGAYVGPLNAAGAYQS